MHAIFFSIALPFQTELVAVSVSLSYNLEATCQKPNPEQKRPLLSLALSLSLVCTRLWSESYKTNHFMKLCHCCSTVFLSSWWRRLLSAWRTKAEAEAVLCPQPAWLNLALSLPLSMVLKERSIRLQVARIGPRLIHYNNWLTMHWRWPCSKHQLQSCPIAL